MATGVSFPGRARLAARTLRADRWWVQLLITAAVLLAFVVYATWRAFEGRHYWSAPYLSPFYSPCLAVNCTEGAAHFGEPVGQWWRLSPALIILVVPLSFRLTCYYYRRAYYRSFWLSPPSCAVAEPHRRYSGESRFPLLLQNYHRYGLFASLLLNVILTWDAVIAFRDPDGNWGHLGLGTLVLTVNAALLWGYSLTCHASRHVVGGRINNFGKHPVRYRLWTLLSRGTPHHPKFAWASLVWVALADLYVRLVASGAISDPRFL